MKHTFDFISAKKYTALISGLVFILGIVFFGLNGFDFKYGIDFQGGSQLQVKLGQKSTALKVKSIIGDLGKGSNVDVIAVGDDNTEFRIRASLGKSIPEAEKAKLIQDEVIHKLKAKYGDSKILTQPDYTALVISLSIDLGEASSVSDLESLLGKAVNVKPLEDGNESKYIIDTTFSQLIAKTKVEEPLQKEFPGLNIKDNTTYDPTQGAAIKEQALLVSLLVLSLILFYIGIRFQFKFGVAAIIALIHDVIVVLCFILFFDREVDTPTVVALLTIMGYSLNDTIVVFDRIRENKEILATEDNDLVVNNSIHQSLSRTIVTSLTTLFVVGCLLVLGGPALENLSFALFVGVIVGTYSSIFVASPILVIWENLMDKRDKRKTKKLRKSPPGKRKKMSEDKVVV